MMVRSIALDAAARSLLFIFRSFFVFVNISGRGAISHFYRALSFVRGGQHSPFDAKNALWPVDGRRFNTVRLPENGGKSRNDKYSKENS